MNNSILIQDTEVLIFNPYLNKSNINHIVVFLHWYGANSKDLSFMNKLKPFNNSLNIYPQGFIKLDNQFTVDSFCWGEFSNPNEYNDQMELSAEKIKKLIFEIQNTITNSENVKISIVGFSQGGMLAQILAFTKIHNVENLILLSTMLPDFSESKFESNINNFFIGHGEYDEVIDIQSAVMMYNLYTKHGYTVNFNKYKTGHNIDYKLFEDISIYKFN